MQSFLIMLCFICKLLIIPYYSELCMQSRPWVQGHLESSPRARPILMACQPHHALSHASPHVRFLYAFASYTPDPAGHVSEDGEVTTLHIAREAPLRYPKQILKGQTCANPKSRSSTARSPLRVVACVWLCVNRK